MLTYRHINEFGLVFSGSKTAQALRDCSESSSSCFDRLMGSMKDSSAEHKFDFHFPLLRGPWDDERILALNRKRESKRRKFVDNDEDIL